MNRFSRQIAIVAWPAFVAAGVIETFVFAFVEPASLHTLGGAALELSATAVYSLAFFVFWALVAGACWVGLRLARSAAEINAAGLEPPGAPGRES